MGTGKRSKSGREQKVSKSPESLAGVGQKLKFSFEYYAFDPSWCFSKLDSNALHQAIVRLKELSQKTHSDIIRERFVLHWHEIDWQKTTRKDGFGISAVQNLEHYQVALLGVNGQLCRLHGAYSENVFYVVWVDPSHELQISNLKGT